MLGAHPQVAGPGPPGAVAERAGADAPALPSMATTSSSRPTRTTLRPAASARRVPVSKQHAHERAVTAPSERLWLARVEHAAHLVDAEQVDRLFGHARVAHLVHGERSTSPSSTSDPSNCWRYARGRGRLVAFGDRVPIGGDRTAGELGDRRGAGVRDELAHGLLVAPDRARRAVAGPQVAAPVGERDRRSRRPSRGHVPTPASRREPTFNPRPESRPLAARKGGKTLSV